MSITAISSADCFFSGKSTFLKILAGEEQASQGSVEKAKNHKIGILKQDHFRDEEDRLVDVVIRGNTVLWDALIEKDAEPETIFTGRKITHLAITGYKTMGNRNVYDPCRNLFEGLHIFQELTRENGNYELLSEVIAKKSLWSRYPLRPVELPFLPPFKQQKDVRRVGKIIPFPSVNALAP